MSQPSWRTLAEMDLRFARSRRRAKSRRRELPRRSRITGRGVRIGLLTLVLLAVVGESTRLDTAPATAQSPRARATPVLDPTCPVPARFRTAFASAAEKTGVPLQLLVATAYEESRMDPAARSGAGARGLLQLMPATAQALRLDGDDPAANVLAGASYLRQMLDRFGSVDLALAAYNAGPTAVARAGSAPTLETLRYVKNVERRAGRLLSCR